MIPYFKLAAENGYTVLVLEPATEWSHDPSRLAAMTSHGVPQDKIELMQSRWLVRENWMISLRAVLQSRV